MKRNVICWEIRQSDMLEKEMPMPIATYVKLMRDKSLQVVKERGLEIGFEYFWFMIDERTKLYRRWSEQKYAIKLGWKHGPIKYRYNSMNVKEYFLKKMDV